jgi:L-histidine Nalpha-methyltransferase
MSLSTIRTVVGRVENWSATNSFQLDVLAGLCQPQKVIPAKHLYDEYGSQLFDQITELDEYYPSRTETAIMREHGAEMARQIGPGCLLIEYGSGNSAKTRVLLDHLSEPAGYVPIDISEEHLHASAEVLSLDYPDLRIFPIAADFTSDVEVPEIDVPVRRNVVYFPGSTIGNFKPDTAKKLLVSIAELAGRDGALFLGVDLQKSIEVLEAAYNDAAGVTAAFNLNMLTRINRELDANFDLSSFEHRARYNHERHCIEMLIVSRRDQAVQVGAHQFHFAAGERILTERSHKYSLAGFEELARSAGFEVEGVWMDENQLFSVQYLTVTPQGE